MASMNGDRNATILVVDDAPILLIRLIRIFWIGIQIGMGT
jgi:hypothetical protein